jgi:hypothetical protein
MYTAWLVNESIEDNMENLKNFYVGLLTIKALI